MSFLEPAALLLLIPVALLAAGYGYQQVHRKKYVVRFSNVDLLATVAPRRPGWRRHLTFSLFLIALIVLSVGVAKPTANVKVPRERATVMLAIDVSLSMQATDISPTRLDAAKVAAKAFVDTVPPRINIGLVKFAQSANVLVPPTIDRDAVKVAIDNLDLAESTAIGEAVYACLDAIDTFSKATTAKDDKPAPAHIVLMSDGKSNKGRLVGDAAAAAKKAETPVSTIAFGTDGGTVSIDGQDIPVPADKTTLRNLANTTGGSYHAAASAEEIRNVFKDIGSQIGYTKAKRDISYRFLLAGLLFALAAAGTSLLWGGRLL